MSAANSKRSCDSITFDAEMEFFDLGDRFTHGWEDQATSRTTCGATDPSPTLSFRQQAPLSLLDCAYLQQLGNPIIDEVAPGIHEYHVATPIEGPDSLLGPYGPVIDTTQDAPLGDISGFDYAIDWTLFSALDPLVDNSFLVNTGTVQQYNTALNPSALPEEVPSYTYPAIAPAATNSLAPPDASSGAHVGAQHRVIDTRIRCTAPGCSKTFRRVGDCRRHMRKHQAPKLNCIVDGCDMKFTRLDKVRDHLRQGHKIVL